jgi:O-antigen/teichoic acid export membrane protein
LSLKRLASQTVWYGLSNVVARLITYLLTPFLARVLIGPRGEIEAGSFTTIYSWLPLLNVLFTYGMETAFFRFSSSEDKDTLYRTQASALLISTLLLCGLMVGFAGPIAAYGEIPGRADYVLLCAGIVGFDTIAALPYARLRQDNKPRKYALIKVVGILIFVGTVVGLFALKGWVERNPTMPLSAWWQRYWGLGFILVANLVQCVLTMGMLWKELADFRPKLDRAVLGRVMRYSWPILLTGFAGQFNDSMNRVMFMKIHEGTRDENLRLIGHFGMAAKLAVMINLAIQAFRMAAEPFFFAMADKKDAPETYARVMKWFVILLAGMFLSVALYIDLWRHFIGEYQEAIGLVPVLLLGYVALGIYYNLTVWYKLSNRTIYGTYTVCIGAAVAVIFNLLFIPSMGYAACAWSMLLSYAVMVALSYVWGQKFYPIPYNVRKLGAYLGVALVLWAMQRGVMMVTDDVWLRTLSATVWMAAFGALVWWAEKNELKRVLAQRKR